MLPFDPEVLARRLVAVSHDTKPDLFSGKWVADALLVQNLSLKVVTADPAVEAFFPAD
jgi:hypothetical protein